MTHLLIPDAPAPALSLPVVGGGTWTLADQTPGSFTMIVIYRGLHCPVCKTYLTKLSAMMDDARSYGLNVVVASMDGMTRAAQAKADWGLTDIPVAFDLSVADVKNWGLYLSTSIKEAEPAQFAEPGLFWVRGDGRLYLVDISNMPFSRPDLDILIPKAKMAMDNNYPARGTTAV
ncbi:MAG: redoxin domain-containing protein [Loktanella sp.]|nr:redoxin domain-containing protein [Loktanella sp.]